MAQSKTSDYSEVAFYDLNAVGHLWKELKHTVHSKLQKAFDCSDGLKKVVQQNIIKGSIILFRPVS